MTTTQNVLKWQLILINYINVTGIRSVSGIKTYNGYNQQKWHLHEQFLT
jgi:hypothetical protein